MVITVVDSRIDSFGWKLYASFVNPMKEEDGKVLVDSLLFKKFDDEIIRLSTNKKLVYEASGSSSGVSINNITFSADKGLLLSPTRSLLEGKDYSTMVIWSAVE